MDKLSMLIKLSNLCLLAILPFVLLGMINRVKARWAGRQGPAVWQPWYDFVKLMRKGEVISTTSSLVFRIAPTIACAAVLLAGLLTPILKGQAVLSFEADLIVFAYILALGKFFTIIGAMDTGSSFEGMGASREATFSTLVEPAFLIILASLSLYSGVSSFQNILAAAHHPTEISALVLILSVIPLFIMLLAEGCRVPVDDPNTHLELTMIHEVMVLDNSGPDLGFILYASGLKMVLIGALIANLCLSPELPLVFALLGFLGIQFLLAVCIGTIESVLARLRMTHIPQFLLFMTSIGFVLLSIIVINLSGR